MNTHCSHKKEKKLQVKVVKLILKLKGFNDKEIMNMKKCSKSNKKKN